jgi:16S rRNA (cytidine1402-2'-O)-methyltransferase
MQDPSGGTLASKSGAPKAEPRGGLPAGLYIVATPIGNLGDITSRAIDTLLQADLIACEDTRVTGTLRTRFGISTPMTPYHDHNAEQMRPELVARLRGGAAIALVSDAGTPLISDPGYKLVRDCIDAGVTVVPIPGASALLAALVVSGLPSDRVLFAGFLPPKSGPRREAAAEFRDLAVTVVFYETAPRLAAALGDLANVLGPRPAAVCRELTKLHEEIRRGTLDELAAYYAGTDAPKGEIVVVVGGAERKKTAASAEDLDTALTQALASQSLRDAAAGVAEALGLPRRAVYARALELAKER